MADLLSKEMLADIVINIINILILFFVTKRLLYKPVKKYLDSRREGIQKSLEDARMIKTDAEEKKAEYESLLSAADEKGKEIIDSARRDAESQAEGIIARAKAEADEITATSNENARRDAEKIMAEAKEQIADAAIELSGKIIGREITDADNRRLIDEFFGA